MKSDLSNKRPIVDRSIKKYHSKGFYAAFAECT